MKGYKVFNPDWTCEGKQYSCPGVFEQEGKLELCKNGIHFCKELANCFNYYDFNPKNKVAEIEAVGEVIESKSEGRYCTSKIKIIKELSWNKVLNLVNIGDSNTGMCNTGNENSGDYNTGNYNTGNFNTAAYNSGDYNSGYCNIGDYNAGYYNSGSYNAGHFNSGERNTGCYNTGNYNTGNYNTGDYNSGDYNIGNHNTGDYNSGNKNFGCFNTGKSKMIFFDKQSDWTYIDWKTSDAKKVLDKMEPKCVSWIDEYNMTEEEKKCSEYKPMNGFLKYRGKEELYSLRQKWWDGLSKKEKESVLNLPNFDASVFKKITGIDVTIEK